MLDWSVLALLVGIIECLGGAAMMRGGGLLPVLN